MSEADSGGHLNRPAPVMPGVGHVFWQSDYPHLPKSSTKARFDAGKNLFWRHFQSYSSWPPALRACGGGSGWRENRGHLSDRQPGTPSGPNRSGAGGRSPGDVPPGGCGNRRLRGRRPRMPPGRPTYTIDTARELKKEGWSEVTWLIGADMLNTLPTWHEAHALLREVRFIVMARPGTAFAWDRLPPAFEHWRRMWFGFRRSISAGRRSVGGRGWDCPIEFFCPPKVCRYIAGASAISDAVR